MWVALFPRQAAMNKISQGKALCEQAARQAQDVLILFALDCPCDVTRYVRPCLVVLLAMVCHLEL